MHECEAQQQVMQEETLKRERKKRLTNFRHGKIKSLKVSPKAEVFSDTRVFQYSSKGQVTSFLF